jgi:hypothetical protein
MREEEALMVVKFSSIWAYKILDCFGNSTILREKHIIATGSLQGSGILGPGRGGARRSDYPASLHLDLGWR